MPLGLTKVKLKEKASQFNAMNVVNGVTLAPIALTKAKAKARVKTRSVQHQLKEKAKAKIPIALHAEDLVI